MTMTPAYTEHLSEQWLLERTYHAHLRNGRELSVPSLTEAMKQLIDFPVPLSSQSYKSKLAERMPSGEEYQLLCSSPFLEGNLTRRSLCSLSPRNTHPAL